VCENDPNNPNEAAAIFEPWDIKISRHPTQKLALMGGGHGFQCGMMFRSTDDGTTWVQEPHECDCVVPPCFSPCTPDNGYSEGEAYPGDTTLYRLVKMRTMYNLAIFDADNSAVAVGYNGQTLWRDPVAQVWRDRSTHSENYLTATSAVVYPRTGAAPHGGNGPSGIAIAPGRGGYVRRSIDGGQTWGDDLHGEPYRPQDVHFLTSVTGWMCGQFSRVATTIQAGKVWDQGNPPPGFGEPNLNAIVFADSLRGVAVGGFKTLSDGSKLPKILFSENGVLNNQWNDASTSITYSNESGIAAMRDVSYAPGSTHVWAAGDQGFVLRSRNNGRTWNQILNSGSQDTAFNIESVAFLDSSTGLFAGVRAGVGTIQQLKVVAGQFQWTTISPTTVFGTHALIEVAEVRITGNDAFAVGETTHPAGSNTIREGVVLHATYSGGNFGTFNAFSSAGQFPACVTGYNVRGQSNTFGPTSPVLRALAPLSSSELWVGGECGRVWHLASGTWAEVKSQTDAHIRGISFPGGSSPGFFVGYRFFQTTQALVRYQ
jgi:photosystem II stability/assembly factor-like uncharacterized protein